MKNSELPLSFGRASLTVLWLTLLCSQATWAIQPLAPKFFKSGHYILEHGTMGECGDGHFSFHQKDQRLQLGPLHGFFVKAEKGSLPGDAPSDIGCLYDFETSVRMRPDETLLTFSEKRLCDKVLKHELTETAHLHADHHISLTLNQSGEPSFTYECRWKLKAQK